MLGTSINEHNKTIGQSFASYICNMSQKYTELLSYLLSNVPTVICGVERYREALVNHTMLVSGARRTSYPGAGAHSSDITFVNANSARFDEVRPMFPTKRIFIDVQK